MTHPQQQTQAAPVPADGAGVDSPAPRGNLLRNETSGEFSIQDARRGRYVVEQGEWRRSNGHTYLMVRVPDNSDLSCRATRENALDAAIAGVPVAGKTVDGGSNS